MAKKKQLAAIIHLRSERVTMQLIEYTDLYAVTILDEASQTVRLGDKALGLYDYIYKFEVPSKEKINDLEGVIENCGVGVVRYK